jgi:hypothetical protein
MTAPDWPELEGYGVETVGELGNTPSTFPACVQVNPDALPRLVELVPADANASGSAGLAKEALLESRAPIPAHLRTQELLAHYAPALPVAPIAGPEVLVQLRKSPFIKGLFELLVAVEAPPMAPENRPPLALTLVVDTTTSIGPVIDRSVAAITAIAQGLRAGDSVHWVTSAPDAAETLTIDGPAAPDLLDRASTLQADVDESATSLDALLATGYSVALGQHVPGAWNRVVVISDGQGSIDAATHETVKSAAMPGTSIHTLVVGVGKAIEHNPRMLRLLSHAGRGPYLHLYDGSAAELEQRFVELVGITADALSVEIQVPWYFEIQRPYLFESTAPGAAEPQYLAPGQSLVFPFRLQACDENALSVGDPIDITIGLADAASGAAMPLTVSPTLGELLSVNSHAELDQTFAVVAYAEALRSLDAVRLQNAHTLATSANLQEIADLLLLHPAYPP